MTQASLVHISVLFMPYPMKKAKTIFGSPTPENVDFVFSKNHQEGLPRTIVVSHGFLYITNQSITSLLNFAYWAPV